LDIYVFSLIELLVEYTPFVVSTGNSSFIITWQMKTTDDVIVFHGRMKVDKRVVIFYQLPYLYTSCKKNIIPFFISIFYTAYIGKIFLHIILLWVRISLMVKCIRYNIMWSSLSVSWFSLGTPVSSTNITEILLKVALNTITLTSYNFIMRK
jgi:hypothetical protein